MSSDKKSSWNPRLQSSTPKHRVDEANMYMDRNESWMECDPGESSRSFVDNDKPAFENAFPVEIEELSAQPEASEHALEEGEQVRSGVQQRDKLSQISESVPPQHPRATRFTMVQEHIMMCETPDFAGPREDAEQHVCSSSSSTRTLRPANHETASESLDTTTVTSSSPREHESVRGELRAKSQRLKEKDYWIRSLEADVATLQRTREENSTALAFARHQLRSCQAQLDNVQRFISTADTHADQDIIQKLQELNEEVYQMSMAVADYVAEGFARQSATARQMKEHTSVGGSVLATIGQVMVDHLAAVEGGEDIALFLQIAFQGYLSHLLCHVVSSWTVDPRLNALIEGTYQRLRKAETQPISGRWRSLTCTHILPSTVSDPKVLVEYAMTGLSNIIMAAGLQPNGMSKLSSEFGGKILSIVSHAGRFGDMVSGMISGDFEVFAVQPGATFDGESMVDMNEDQVTPRGTGAPQIVLCVYRVGLKKQMGEKIMTVIKAQIVLKSFLGW